MTDAVGTPTRMIRVEMAITVRANGVVAVLEELGDRVDAALEKLRQEEERDDDQGDGGHPLVAGDGHAEPVGGLAAHADELLGRDVGGDERKADQPPGQPATGEEVVLGAIARCGSPRPGSSRDRCR